MKKVSSLIVVLALFGFITPSFAEKEKSLEEITGKIAKTCSADSTEQNAVSEVSEDSARVEDKAKSGATTIEGEE